MVNEIEERIKRYRSHAADALNLAATAKPEQRALFLRLAQQWLQLADMLERGLMD